LQYLYLCVAAFAAGVVNSLAGGGTLLTFPALLGAPDVNAVIANATSTVALVPGSIAGAWGYRRELGAVQHWVKLLVWPSLAGGLVGALLVIVLPERYFSRLVPWLILTATILFLCQPVIARFTGIGRTHAEPSAAKKGVLIGFQFLVAIYGGYFGAGIGILMLSSLSLMGIGDMNRMNAAKTFLAAAINGVAIVVFVAGGTVHWPYAAVMAVAASAGGYAGAHFALRIPREVVRWIVIMIGLILSAKYFLDQLSG
jgi:uncharacterized membrane protein YfcA